MHYHGFIKKRVEDTYGAHERQDESEFVNSRSNGYIPELISDNREKNHE